MTIDEAKALAKLVKACKASGVSLLRRGDLELQFLAGDAAKTTVPATGDAVETPSAEKLKEIEEQANVTENSVDADEELAFMQVEDPSLFEQLLVERELVDGGQNEIETDDRRLESVLSGGRELR